MRKLLILRGIPGSGKSTFAREFIKDKSEDWVIVNRDSIRDMLGNYWVPSREKLVTDIEHSMVDKSLKLGYNVVLDATNFNKRSIGAFEVLVDLINYDSDEQVKIEFKDFNVDLETAIERDKNRDRTVGEKVIRSFYKRRKDE